MDKLTLNKTQVLALNGCLNYFIDLATFSDENEPWEKKDLEELRKLRKKLWKIMNKLNSEKADKTCVTKHVIPPKSKDSGILPNFT